MGTELSTQRRVRQPQPAYSQWGLGSHVVFLEPAWPSSTVDVGGYAEGTDGLLKGPGLVAPRQVSTG